MVVLRVRKGDERGHFQQISDGLYVLVTLKWLIPDKRIKSKLVDPHPICRSTARE